jgi:hypothetical protein
MLMSSPPSPLLIKARKGVATLLVNGGLLAALVGFGAERIDPVTPLPTPISCSNPGHDLALTKATKENPALELYQYAPGVAIGLGLPDAHIPPVDEACPQDRENVVSTVEQMISDGEFKNQLR